MFKGTSARIIFAIGMPTFAFAWYFGALSLKSIERNILRFSGVKPIRESLFSMGEAASHEKRTKWLEKMRDAERRDAR